MLSMPSTISRAVRVNRATHVAGSEIHAINDILLRFSQGPAPTDAYQQLYYLRSVSIFTRLSSYANLCVTDLSMCLRLCQIANSPSRVGHMREGPHVFLNQTSQP